MSIEWQEAYRIGLNDIDAQHRHLFQLTNDLLQATELDAVRKLIMALYKHTREHFELEESHMRRFGFEPVEQHAHYHNQLLGRLNVISAQVGKGELDKVALEKLMTDWALRHIPGDDAVFAKFVAEHTRPAL